jgi:murein DD-endopeptidase MepM/ murein hydrolase activator NlpD
MLRRFLILSLIILIATSGFAYSIENIEGERVQYDNTVLPVDNLIISSGFGPRLKASGNYKYDFHRGIDLPGNTGDSVYAIEDADVYRVYFEGEAGSPYRAGGTVIILRHNLDIPFELGGETHNRYYSLYMHLDSVDSSIDIDDVKNGYPYPKVKKGEIIGTIGSSGTTDFEHLHFETRVGTVCSLESSCSHGYDPHVNPFYFIPYSDNDNYKVKIAYYWPSILLIESNPNELDIEEIVIRKRSNEKIINFSNRIGIDPYNADKDTYENIRIYPFKFNSSSSKYKIGFIFNSFFGFDEIEVKDIWGKGKRIIN